MEVSYGNIFKDISVSDDEVFDQILKTNGVKIERITSSGQASPDGFWYDQDDAEWVLVLDGKAVVEFEYGKTHSLSKGDYLYIEPHKKHRVASTKAGETTLWLAIHIKV